MVPLRFLGLSALTLVALAAVVAADCENADYGSFVDTGDSELSTDFVQAADGEDAEFRVLQYDPDDDTTRDETYYLRFVTQTDQDAIHAGDLNLRTGQWVDSGDRDTDYAASKIDESFATALDILGYIDSSTTFWYLDLDNSGDLTRLDLRLSEVTIDNDDYVAGTFVLLSDTDYDAFGGETADESLSVDDNDLAWFDDDSDDEVNEGDCILFMPAGFDADATVDDVRFTGTSPSPPDNEEPEPEEQNAAPTAAIEATSETGFAPLKVIFVLDADDADNDDLTWTFDANGDGTVDESGDDGDLPAIVTFTYTEAGMFDAELTVNDGTDETTDTLAIDVDPEIGTEPVTDDTTTDDATTDDASDDDVSTDDGGNGIPGLALPALLATLGAVLVLRRRSA